jgi:hypothetical protein
MAKTKAEVDGRNVVLTEEQNPLVTLRVRRKGASRISTGEHDPRGGDLLYDEGEEFTVARDVAEALIERDYVDEVKPVRKASA